MFDAIIILGHNYWRETMCSRSFESFVQNFAWRVNENGYASILFTIFRLKGVSKHLGEKSVLSDHVTKVFRFALPACLHGTACSV